MSRIKRIKEKIKIAFQAHMKALKETDSQEGASLIEVLIAVTIILIMMTFIGVGVANFIPKAQRTAAKNNISVFKNAAETFYLDNLTYPDALEELVPYINKSEIPKDPWGEDFHYKLDDEGKPYFATFGKDKSEGTEDDIDSNNYDKPDPK